MFKELFPTQSKTDRNPFIIIQNSLDEAIKDFYKLSRDFNETDFQDLKLAPSVDIVEDDEHLKYEIELAGLGPEDVSATVSDGYLHIKGEKHISKKDKGKNYVRREIGYGYYQRSIPLPDYLDSDRAEASFKKGMLWVSFPKKKGSSLSSKEIKVKAA